MSRRAADEPPAPPPPLHELEAEVMDMVWGNGSATVREVMESLNAAAPRPRAYTTYLTVCRRLDAKGLLSRRRHGKTDVYVPAMTRRRYADLRAAAEVGALVAEFGDEALVHFAREIGRLDPERRRRLRRLAEEE